MRNPCIDCKDGNDDRSKCECPHWEKRTEYLHHLYNGGTYFDTVQAARCSVLPLPLAQKNSFSIEGGTKEVIMTEHKAVDSPQLTVDGQKEPEKTCKKCGETKPLSKFVASKNCRKDGHENTCKECRKQWKYRYENNRKSSTAPSSLPGKEQLPSSPFNKGEFTDKKYVYLDFTDDRDLEMLKKLRTVAAQNRRTVEQQIMWILENREPLAQTCFAMSGLYSHYAAPGQAATVNCEPSTELAI